MNKIIIVLLLILVQQSHAANWYFRSSGNDITGDGSITNPYASIAKFNSIFSTVSPGDSLLFRRGDTFYGAAIISRSGTSLLPIVIGSYGVGAKPIFSGLSVVSGWSNLGGNIWEAPATNVKNIVNLVLKDGIIQQVGRYPNSDAVNGGYLTIASGTRGAIGATSTLTGTSLSSVTDWTNAELVIKIKNWDIQRQKVIAHSGGTLSYTEPFGSYTPASGYGYFFQRDPRTLDQNGEWWYDTINSRLRMYFSDDPNLHNVSISTIDTLIYAVSKNYITVRDIQFIGANAAGIWQQSCDAFLIKRCDFTNMGKEAATGWFSTHSIIDSCTAQDCLSAGLHLRNTIVGDKFQTVTNCIINRTAMIAGMEKSGDQNPRSGITVTGDSSNIMYNRVTNSGWGGIEWEGSRVHIKYNFVDTCLIVRDDGGGIYSYEGMTSPQIGKRVSREIVKNIVLHSLGSIYGVPSNTGQIHAKGIYLDEGTRVVLVDSNTVAYVNGSAYYSNSSDSLTLTNNTSWQNSIAYTINRFSNAPAIRSIIIKKNIFIPYVFTYSNSAIDNPVITRDADISAMGIIDSNYIYANSTDNSLKSETMYTDGSHYTLSYTTLKYLQTTIRVEAGSKRTEEGGIFQYNMSSTPIKVNIGNNGYYDIYGTRYFNELTLQPFSSTIITPMSGISVYQNIRTY